MYAQLRFFVCAVLFHSVYCFIPAVVKVHILCRKFFTRSNVAVRRDRKRRVFQFVIPRGAHKFTRSLYVKRAENIYVFDFRRIKETIAFGFKHVFGATQSVFRSSHSERDGIFTRFHFVGNIESAYLFV